jgi:signal transduction histidine kinase
MFRTPLARLAAVYTVLFAVSVVVLAVITLFATRAALSKLFDQTIQAEARALALEYRSEGVNGVLMAVRDRDGMPGALNYGLEGPGEKPLAGRLAGVHAHAGWQVVAFKGVDGPDQHLRVYALNLPDGNRLLVGEDVKREEALDGVVLGGFAWAFVGVVVIGIGLGYGLSRDVHRRLTAISATAEAIIDGDLSRRVPVAGAGDDLDRMASTFNRMLDRIGALMESLRQVSNDIAHDLRTPLNRMRRKLEAALASKDVEAGQEAVREALAELDLILETFAALLRIAQIESGARRAGFKPTDLTAVAMNVVDAFAPAAEDSGHVLHVSARTPTPIEGDRELLTQMLANLVENALRHTPAGSRIEVGVTGAGDGAVVRVVDNGPGAPAAERDRLFDRFYRLERSRSDIGYGLGLALVGAIAKLHEAEVELSDARPGLKVLIRFPA